MKTTGGLSSWVVGLKGKSGGLLLSRVTWRLP